MKNENNIDPGLAKVFIKIIENLEPVIKKYEKELQNQGSKNLGILSIYPRSYFDLSTFDISRNQFDKFLGYIYEKSGIDLARKFTSSYADELGQIEDEIGTENTHEYKVYIFPKKGDLGKLIKLKKKLLITQMGGVFSEEDYHDNIFTVTVRDREILVNNYLIGKPHAVGGNYEFFDYIRSKKSHIKINRSDLPNFGGSRSLREEIKNKSFIKIISELGFKGEIGKAFFYNRGKDTITYRGDRVVLKDIKNAGVKMPKFLKELQTANNAKIRNSPK